jgi:hypothetical protein
MRRASKLLTSSKLIQRQIYSFYFSKLKQGIKGFEKFSPTENFNGRAGA